MLVVLVLVVIHSGGEDHHHCHCCVVIGVGSSGVVVVPLVVINTGSGWLALVLVGLVMGSICHCCHCHPGPSGHIVDVDGREVVVAASSLTLFWHLLHH